MTGGGVDGSGASGRALLLLAIAAVLGLCWVAREVLMPTALGLVLAATVSPLVGWLERRRLPRPAAAALGTLLVVAVVAGLALVLYDRVSSFADELPSYQDRVDEIWKGIRHHVVRLQAQSEKLVTPPRQPGQVRVQETVRWGSVLLGTASGLTAVLAGATIAVFMIYFALEEAPRYRDKLIAWAGPGRARVEEALDELRRDVSQYMLNRVALNAILGVVTALIFTFYGLEHAAVWGLTTALLHFIPYLGPAVGLVLPTGMALLQYGSVGRVVGVAAIYLGLVALQGNVVDPIFLGKQLRLSAMAVFLGSLLWFLIWGPVGLFLAVPLLSTIRVVCRHTARFRMVAALLAE